MGKKLLTIFSALIVVSMLISAAALDFGQTSRSVANLGMFNVTKFDAHYRVPNEGAVNILLEDAGVLSPMSSPSFKSLSVQQYLQEFIRRNPETPAPEKLRELLDLERLKDFMKPVETDRSIKSLVTLVEFAGTDEVTYNGTDENGNCVDKTVTTSGPLHNEIPSPGARDNNTVWYDDTTPDLYEQIYFGEGPDAGVVINHPNLGAIDLRGKTMVNYYLEQSGGKFAPAGEVYPMWFQAAHSEGYYGADSCEGGSHNVRAPDLVEEVVDMLVAQDPGFNWESFDGDANGIVDNFTVIHAGMGQEAGGGAQGELSIWSHASLINWPDGKLVCAQGAAGCPDRNIYVREYSMDPENIDLGVISEEFGHAAFGLPDLYTTDYQTSIANWAIMEAGSWNGILGGMEPAPFPLWFRYMLGWAQPKEIAYDAAPTATVVGQLSKTPPLTYQGLKINLPDKVVTVINPLDTGQAWWSNVGDLLSNTLAHGFSLAGATAPIFSFSSYWSLEEDWDYGYVEVSTDGGATWTMLQDTGGFMTDTDPNGNNQGWGLTGEGQGTLSFDLSAYVGMDVQLRLRYSSDLAVQWKGWWADDFALKDGDATLFSDDVEAGGDDWTADGWTLVPLTQSYPVYYLVEWRNLSGFDHGLLYPYQTVYSDADNWEVDRAPYTVPGMLLYLRDASYAFDYTLGDAWYDPPSWGAHHGLLVVDSHYYPYGWDDYTYASGAPLRVGSRVQPADAPFTVQQTTPFTLRLGYDPATGQYVDEPLQTKTFGPRPAVSAFHDSLGYTPGFLLGQDGYLYWWDRVASAVLPARGDYTSRITDVDMQPLTDLYGIDIGGTVLGSGNPGDSGVQYGLHVAVLGKSQDGSWGLIQTWNSPALTTLKMSATPTPMRQGQLITYALTLKNPTPSLQKYTLTDAIPEDTTYVSGLFYDKSTNSIVRSGVLMPNATQVLTFQVKVNQGVPKGTVITNEAVVTDDALGSGASVDVTVR